MEHQMTIEAAQIMLQNRGCTITRTSTDWGQHVHYPEYKTFGVHFTKGKKDDILVLWVKGGQVVKADCLAGLVK